MIEEINNFRNVMTTLIIGSSGFLFTLTHINTILGTIIAVLTIIKLGWDFYDKVKKKRLAKGK